MKKNIEKTTLEFHDDAEIYDAINDFDDDVLFWKKWCKKAGKSVLELCCGTGRISITLIKAGFDFYGIDLSKQFLICANEKASEIKGQYVFKLDDIRSFNLGKKFDSIIIPFNAFDLPTFLVPPTMQYFILQVFPDQVLSFRLMIPHIYFSKEF